LTTTFSLFLAVFDQQSLRRVPCGTKTAALLIGPSSNALVIVRWCHAAQWAGSRGSRTVPPLVLRHEEIEYASRSSFMAAPGLKNINPLRTVVFL